MYRIGWFSTGCDEAARDLLTIIYQATERGDIPADLLFVFSNREPQESAESDRFITLVRQYGLPLVTLSSARFQPGLRHKGREEGEALERWRETYDREVAGRLSGYRPDVIILAGYMLIVSKALCRTYKMVNLHPALPDGPVGTWQEVIRRLIDEKSDEAGAMMHVVTEELDRGPAVTYVSFPLRAGRLEALWKPGARDSLFSQIRAEGVKREMPLIYYTLKKLAEGEIRIQDSTVLRGNELLNGGHCLNDEVNKYLEIQQGG